jgi:hypothetical protein
MELTLHPLFVVRYASAHRRCTMSIYTMSDELLGLARTDVIRRLESVHRIESELIEKLAQYDTEVARRDRVEYDEPRQTGFPPPPWDETDPTQDSIDRDQNPLIDRSW